MGDNPRLGSLLRGAEPHPSAAMASVGSPAPLSTAMTALRRHWKTIALTSAATVAAAVLYLAVATSQYTATGLILIDTKSGTSMRSGTPAPSDANVDSANIESQIELLKSERVLRRVVVTQHLENDPALQPGPIGRALDAVKRTIVFWKSASEPQAGDDPEVTAAARQLQKLTTVKRLGMTYVVEISATLPSGVQAADVVNAYADAFIQDQMQLREDIARRISGLLQARTTELQAQTQKAENDVEQFKFSGSLSGENSAQARVQLKNLESTAQTYRVLHDKFLERYAETWQQQFMSLPDAQVASRAYPPQSKSAPKSAIILAAALFAGAALGLVLVITRDRRIIGLEP